MLLCVAAFVVAVGDCLLLLFAVALACHLCVLFAAEVRFCPLLLWHVVCCCYCFCFRLLSLRVVTVAASCYLCLLLLLLLAIAFCCCCCCLLLSVLLLLLLLLRSLRLLFAAFKAGCRCVVVSHRKAPFAIIVVELTKNCSCLSLVDVMITVTVAVVVALLLLLLLLLSLLMLLLLLLLSSLLVVVVIVVVVVVARWHCFSYRCCCEFGYCLLLLPLLL